MSLLRGVEPPLLPLVPAAITRALERERGILRLRCNINVKSHHLGFKKNKLWLDLKHSGEEESGREPFMSIENICS